MSKTIAFGLDIGKSSIKAVSFKKAGDKFELEFASVAPPFIKGIDSESLADHQKLAELIKKMVADTGSRNTHVNISLPENQIYTKIIDMPFISERELPTALKWELEQYIPLPLDQVRTAFQVLSVTEVGGTKRMNVFIVAAPISLVKKYEDVLQMANLVPQTIETEILSAIRSLSPLFAQPQPSMLVSIGSSTTSVAILKAGLLESVFTIDLGGLAITRAIASDLGISMEEAENYKKAYGLNKEAFEGKIGQSLNPILNSIAGDIKKALFSYREKNNNLEIQQIVLSGGTSLLPGIDVFFTNALNAQVVIGRCWSVWNIENVPDEIMFDAPSFNVVAGLALKDYFDK